MLSVDTSSVVNDLKDQSSGIQICNSHFSLRSWEGPALAYQVKKGPDFLVILKRVFLNEVEC